MVPNIHDHNTGYNSNAEAIFPTDFVINKKLKKVPA
jgi:hypothetical protein